MWPRPRRASASVRPMTRRLVAEGRTPRRAAQVGHQLSASCCAACPMPCRTSSGSQRAQAASCAAAAARMRARVRWGGVGGGHPCMLPSLTSSMGWAQATRRAGKFQIPVSKGEKRPSAILQNGQISEIGSSLISPKNSSRKFQTHISNSGEQIPKHARQNSEDCRFPVSRNKVRSRGHRFLGTDFSILVSEFKFPPRSRIWDASHFSFLDSRCKSKEAHGLEMTQF